MSNIFTFHGIGQGLFYSGSIYNQKFNFVYDCGSASPKHKKDFEKEIQSLNKHLNFVVISHLHDDHINGLPTLLKHSKIDKLFLPYFYKDPNLYSDVFKASLIINNIKPYTQAYNIALELYDINVNYNSPLQENNIEKIFINNTKEVNDCKNWKFYFYNQRISDTDIQYLNHEIRKLIGNKSIENYVAEVKGSCNNLKEIFEKITSNHNLTSLVLMHWDESYPQSKTLLTGDVRFDDELRERVFNDIQKNDEITLQVPHHGALKEWESLWEPSKNIATTDDIKAQIESFVFSFGQKNSYHHPYGRILVELLQDSSTKDKIKFVYEATPFEYKVP